jgi:spermidine synthase
MPEVVDWNRNPDYKLACDCLADPRTRLEIGDVGDIIARQPGRFDAIILDTDNGTTAMNTPANAALYKAKGLGQVHAALRSPGHVVYWSAGADPLFAKLMERCGFLVDVQRPRIHPTSGGTHVLLVGRKR